MRLHTKRLRCELTLLGDTKEAPETTEKWGVRSRRWNCFLEKVFHDNDNDLTRIIAPFIQKDPQRAVQMPYTSSFQTIMEMLPPLVGVQQLFNHTEAHLTQQCWAGAIKIKAGLRENSGHQNITVKISSLSHSAKLYFGFVVSFLWCFPPPCFSLFTLIYLNKNIELVLKMFIKNAPVFFLKNCARKMKEWSKYERTKMLVFWLKLWPYFKLHLTVQCITWPLPSRWQTDETRACLLVDRVLKTRHLKYDWQDCHGSHPNHFKLRRDLFQKQPSSLGCFSFRLTKHYDTYWAF